MTEDLTRVEDSLRAMLSERAGQAPTVPGLYAAVRHRRRQRRLVLAAGTAVVLVGVGVPAGLAALRDGSAPAPAPAAVPPATPAPPYCPLPSQAVGHAPAQLPDPPAQQDVRGSLRNDQTAVRAILTEGYATITDPKWQRGTGGPRTFSAGSARVLIAHAAYGRIFGLVRMLDSRGRTTDAEVTGDRPTDLHGWVSGYDGTDLPFPEFPELEACGEMFTLVVGDAATTAELSWLTAVRPDGSLIEETAPGVTADGISVVALPSDGRVSLVRVRRNGQVISTYQTGESATAADGLWPSPAAHDEAVRTAPGNADPRFVDQVLSNTSGVWFPLRKSDPRIVWGGRNSSGVSAVVASVALPGGARLAWLSAGEFNTVQLRQHGIVPAGALDRTIFSGTIEHTDSFVVVAARGVRAELVRADGSTRPVQLTQGGAIVDHAGAVRTVRVFDRDGGLIGQVAPGGGLLPTGGY